MKFVAIAILAFVAAASAGPINVSDNNIGDVIKVGISGSLNIKNQVDQRGPAHRQHHSRLHEPGTRSNFGRWRWKSSGTEPSRHARPPRRLGDHARNDRTCQGLLDIQTVIIQTFITLNSNCYQNSIKIKD